MLIAAHIELLRYVRFPSPHEPFLLALWIAHTHCFAGADKTWPYGTPIVDVVSPEPQCGKTVLARLLEALVRCGDLGADLTPASAFRLIEAERPTLLLDEFESTQRGESDAFALFTKVLNAGYTRGGSFRRVNKTTGEVERFRIFCPKAIFRVDERRLPTTTASRTLRIELQRRLPTEQIEPWQQRRDKPELRRLNRQLAQTMRKLAPKLADARPVGLEFLSDRQAEITEHLIAIADAAGGDWPERARHAAQALFEVPAWAEGAPSPRTRLLADCREALNGAKDITSADLVRFLNNLDDAPWATFGRDRDGLDPRGLADLLRPFGIEPQTVRVRRGNAERFFKGYARRRFESAWQRYLTPAEEVDTTPRKRRVRARDKSRKKED